MRTAEASSEHQVPQASAEPKKASRKLKKSRTETLKKKKAVVFYPKGPLPERRTAQHVW